MRSCRLPLLSASSALWAALLVAACRSPAPVVTPEDVTPHVTMEPGRVAAGAPLAVLYSWEIGPKVRPLPGDLRAFVHFLDPEGVLLFADDHVPEPNPASWAAGHTYAYRHVVMTPVVPHVGPVRVQLGLYGTSSGDRTRLRAADQGRLEYRVAEFELLTRDRDLPVHCEGLYPVDSGAAAPFAPTRFVRRVATCRYTDPGEDVVFFLSGDVAPTRFSTPPTLTLATGGNGGLRVSFAESPTTLVRLRLPPKAPGRLSEGQTRLEMSASYVPKTLGVSEDPRELSLRISSVGVFRASRLAPALLEGAAVPMDLDTPQ